MKDKIAYILKSRRKKLNFTPEYVVQELQSNDINIAVKTLYGYEAGRNNINADVFLCLCKIYDIRSFDIFFDNDNNSSEEDQCLLDAYHKHPEMQAAVNKMLDITDHTEKVTQSPSIGAEIADDLTKSINTPMHTKSK